MQLDDHLYKEVFVVGVDNITSTSGELTVCKSFEKMIEHLGTKSVGVNSDLRALHGVLTSAKAIPKDMCGRQAFILLTDPENSGFGILIDSDSDNDCSELAAEVEKLLSAEEMSESFAEIDNVYILYGYEVNIILSVDEDEVDVELIDSCMDVSDRAKELSKAEEN